jgi:hypothetical protein
MAHQLESDSSEAHLRRVRRICGAMPECSEKLSHGEPTFFAAKKVFAMFANNQRRAYRCMDPRSSGLTGGADPLRAGDFLQAALRWRAWLGGDRPELDRR